MRKSKIIVIIVVLLLCISLIGGYFYLPVIKNKGFVSYDEATNQMVYNNDSYSFEEVESESDNNLLIQGSNEEQFSINYPAKAWDFEFKSEHIKELGLGKYNTIANVVENKYYYVFGRYMIENAVRDLDGERHLYKNQNYQFPEFLSENIDKIDLVKTVVYCMNMQEQLKLSDGDPRVFINNYYKKSTVIKSFNDENKINNLIDDINKNGSSKSFFQDLKKDNELSDYWDADYPLFYLRLHFKDQNVPACLAIYWYI